MRAAEEAYESIWGYRRAVWRTEETRLDLRSGRTSQLIHQVGGVRLLLNTACRGLINQTPTMGMDLEEKSGENSLRWLLDIENPKNIVGMASVVPIQSLVVDEEHRRNLWAG